MMMYASLVFCVLKLEFNVSIAVGTSNLNILIMSYKISFLFPHIFTSCLVENFRPAMIYSLFCISTSALTSSSSLRSCDWTLLLSISGAENVRFFRFLSDKFYSILLNTNKHTVHNLFTWLLNRFHATWSKPCGQDCGHLFMFGCLCLLSRVGSVAACWEIRFVSSKSPVTAGRILRSFYVAHMKDIR